MALTISIASEADLRALARARSELDKFGNAGLTTAERMKVVGTRLSGVGRGLTVFSAAAVAGLGMFAKSAISAATEAQVATNRLDAVARSMGVLDPVLGGTTDRLQQFASQLQETTAVEDELIMQGQALLLTFKSVAQSAGTAGGTFDRATQAALDLSAVGLGSVEQASKMLGKALEDPVKGLGALRRASVTFTPAQQEMIKAMVEAGDVAGAQEIILAAVEKQVQGTAAATATSGAKLRVAFGELQEQIGAALLPLVARVTDFLQQRLIPAVSALVERFLNLPGSTQATIGALAGIALAAGPVLLIIGQMMTGLAGLSQAMGVARVAVTLLGRSITMAFLTNPVGLALAAIAVAVIFLADQFRRAYSQSEELREAVGGFMRALGDLGRIITGTIRAAFGGFTTDADKVGGILDRLATVLAPAFTLAVQGMTRYVEFLGKAFQVWFKAIEVVFKILEVLAGLIAAAIITGFQRLQERVRDLGAQFSDLLDRLGPVGDAIRGVAQGAVTAFRAAVDGIKRLFTDLGTVLEPAINAVIRGLNLLIEGYNKLPNTRDVAPIREFAFVTLPATTQATFDAERATSAWAARYTALAAAQRVTATTTADLVPVTTAATTAAGGNAAATEKQREAAERAAAAQQRFKERLTELRGELERAIEGALGYAASIRDRFVGALDLGAALDMAKDTGGNIVGAFIEQGRKMAEFTANMQQLLAAGLSRQAFDQIINAGAQRGADIAAALVKGNIAENVASVNQVYQSVADMGITVGNRASSLFNQQGINMAVAMLEAFILQFMPSGRKRKQLLDAIDDMVLAAAQSLARIPSSVTIPSIGGGGGGGGGGDFGGPGAPPVMVDAGVFGVINLNDPANPVTGAGGVVPLAEGGRAAAGRPFLVGERGPELFVPGVTGQVIPNSALQGGGAGAPVGGNTFHITVNAGMGTDGADVGRRIVDAIRKYERFSGPVFVAA